MSLFLEHSVLTVVCTVFTVYCVVGLRLCAYCPCGHAESLYMSSTPRKYRSNNVSGSQAGVLNWPATRRQWRGDNITISSRTLSRYRDTKKFHDSCPSPHSVAAHQKWNNADKRWPTALPPKPEVEIWRLYRHRICPVRLLIRSQHPILVNRPPFGR